MLICFIGLDGSGKSTLTKISSKLLKQRFGIASINVWAKFGQLSFPKGIKRLILRKSKKKKVYSYEDNPFRVPLDNIIIRYIYLLALLIDHWIRLLIEVQIPLLRNNIVITDRYIYDSIVDLVTNFGLPYINAKKICWYFLPGIRKTPNLMFYLRIPKELAYKRKKDFYSLNYLTGRAKIYEKIAKDFQIIHLDAKLALPELEALLIEILTKEIKEKL